MSRYRLGADTKRRAVQILRDDAWPVVIRSAGSKSPFDVIVLGPEDDLAIQVKRSERAQCHAHALADLAAARCLLPPGFAIQLWVYALPDSGARVWAHRGPTNAGSFEGQITERTRTEVPGYGGNRG